MLRREDRLPIEPLREWLERRLASHYGGSIQAFADAMGVGDQQLRRWLGETNRQSPHPARWCSLAAVDAALIYEESTALSELYPLDEKERDEDVPAVR